METFPSKVQMEHSACVKNTSMNLNVCTVLNGIGLKFGVSKEL